jgi:hypothetical protein
MSKRTVSAKGGATPGKGRRKLTKDDPSHSMYRFKANPEAKRAFKILDENWAPNNLPVVKIAAASLMKDWKEHREIARGCYDEAKGVWNPIVAETFEQFDRVRIMLKGMIELIEGAEARWLVSCAYFALPPRALRKINQRRRRNETRRAKPHAAK